MSPSPSHPITLSPVHLVTATALLGLVLLSACAERRVATSEPPLPTKGPGVFYVALDGNDSWSGNLAAPNRARTDGPFGTLSHAIEAARQFRASSTVQTTPTILVRRGVHFLQSPLVLTAADSPLMLAAFPGESPILSGGRPIDDWKQTTVNGKQLWVADLREVRDGKWFFHQLWVNGSRAVRARHPNKGYLAIGEILDKASNWTQGQSRFRFKDGDIPSFAPLPGSEGIVMTRWVESRLPVTKIEPAERVISFGKKAVFELSAGDLYYLEGAMEFLDAPGEWLLSRAEGRLYYFPLPDEETAPPRAVAPVLAQLLRFEGQPEKDSWLDHVTLRGLTFAHTEWYFPDGFAAKDAPEVDPAPNPDVGGFAQAAIGVPGAVWGRGMRFCAFENCWFANLGDYALELGRGCTSNRISRCTFEDLGAGGLKLGETAIRQNAADRSGWNEVTDCTIGDGGKIFHSAIGVWIGQSPGNRLLHNLIHDFYYTGISIGWTWGYSTALASNNLVAFNHVHHIGVKSNGDGPILSDMAGIYTLGKQPGTVIHNNLWHDSAATRYGGWGIYFDEGSSGILAESNIVYRTTHGGFHQHYGETNLVRNNIFAFARDQQLQRSRPEPHISFTFTTNIVYFDSGVLLGSSWSDDQFRMDWNLYFDTRNPDPASMRFGPDDIEKWRQRGFDQHSIIADPLFVDPKHDNFRLQPDSPAFKLGFKPIDLRSVGAEQAL